MPLFKAWPNAGVTMSVRRAGWCSDSLSKTATLRPASARSCEAYRPEVEAPTTTTSNSIRIRKCSRGPLTLANKDASVRRSCSCAKSESTRQATKSGTQRCPKTMKYQFITSASRLSSLCESAGQTSIKEPNSTRKWIGFVKRKGTSQRPALLQPQNLPSIPLIHNS